MIDVFNLFVICVSLYGIDFVLMVVCDCFGIEVINVSCILEIFLLNLVLICCSVVMVVFFFCVFRVGLDNVFLEIYLLFLFNMLRWVLLMRFIVIFGNVVM